MTQRGVGFSVEDLRSLQGVVRNQCDGQNRDFVKVMKLRALKQLLDGPSEILHLYIMDCLVQQLDLKSTDIISISIEIEQELNKIDYYQVLGQIEKQFHLQGYIETLLYSSDENDFNVLLTYFWMKNNPELFLLIDSLKVSDTPNLAWYAREILRKQMQKMMKDVNTDYSSIWAVSIAHESKAPFNVVRSLFALDPSAYYLYWSQEETMMFVELINNHLRDLRELKREPGPKLKVCVEDFENSDITGRGLGAFSAINRWDKYLDKPLAEYAKKYRKNSAVDLLRLVRNLQNHRMDKPDEVLQLFKPKPYGVLEYFLSNERFPDMIACAYHKFEDAASECPIFFDTYNRRPKTLNILRENIICSTRKEIGSFGMNIN